MEPLHLPSGRFIPRLQDAEEARIRALEAHLSDLTAELEYILAQLNVTMGSVAAVSAAVTASLTSGDAPTAVDTDAGS